MASVFCLVVQLVFLPTRSISMHCPLALPLRLLQLRAARYLTHFYSIKYVICNKRALEDVDDLQFNVFMTHWQNFGNDRLGIYTFKSAFRFLRCWTNLKLRWVLPVEHARLYFDAYTDEKKLYYTVSSLFMTLVAICTSHCRMCVEINDIRAFYRAAKHVKVCRRCQTC